MEKHIEEWIGGSVESAMSRIKEMVNTIEYELLPKLAPPNAAKIDAKEREARIMRRVDALLAAGFISANIPGTPPVDNGLLRALAIQEAVKMEEDLDKHFAAERARPSKPETSTRRIQILERLYADTKSFTVMGDIGHKGPHYMAVANSIAALVADDAERARSDAGEGVE